MADVEDAREPRTDSVFETLGHEVTSIAAPVTICMALTVWLVRTLYLDQGQLSTSAVSIATAIYNEQDSDSVGTKFTGALLNALVFVVTITVMTFVLFFLFKYRYMKFIYGYMGFAGFSIFFFVGGYVSQSLIEKWHVSVDAISYLFVLFNLSVVGVLSLFFMKMPILLKQAYLVAVAVIVALLFTRVPEWTTWFLLVALVVYDMCAVLCPGGPLRALVELAMERNEDIPALVYESRGTPAGPPGVGEPERWGRRGAATRRARTGGGHNPPEAEVPDSAPSGTPGRVRQVHEEGVEAPSDARGTAGGSPADDGDAGGHESQLQPLMGDGEPSHVSPTEEQEEYGLPDSIKLGLGDFIFYSVLVGRASLHSMMAVYVCYLAIMAGLGATLLLLAVYQKALPALPLSISLGVAFYFCTVYILQATAFQISTSLLYV